MQFKDLIFSSNECILYKSTSSGPVAQWIEQLPSKQLVVGSIPARATIFLIRIDSLIKIIVPF